jgi:Tfp pilus assembly protein PilF
MQPFSSIIRACVLTSLLGSAACSSAVQRDPGTVDAARGEPTPAEKRAAAAELCRLGKEQMRTGDSLRAQEYFATAIDSGADADQVLPDLMRAAISGMRYQAAIRYFEDFGSLMSSAHRAELGVVVGVLYLGVEQPERARTAFETALKLQPNNARAHFLLGQILREELADYAGSDAQFRAYLALEPNGENVAAARAGLLVSPEETLAAANQNADEAHALPQRVER